MSTILAIDPGPDESAYVVIDRATRRPIAHGKEANTDILHLCYGYGPADRYDAVAIEMIASYGMPVGAEVFETCVWIGRFYESYCTTAVPDPVLIKRHPVKLHHCHSARATDANITQALVDRFAPGQPNRGKGTKAAPGWFHGFAGDIWAAYALAVYHADTIGDLP